MKVMIPFDGSSAALEAVGEVIRMADEGLSLNVLLANVQEPASLYELMVAHDPAVIEAVSAQAGAHVLEAATERLAAAQITFETVVAQGDPAHALLDLLEDQDCDLVVMGARGQTTLRRAALGSVANEVLHGAGVPVMIVKAGDDIDTVGEI